MLDRNVAVHIFARGVHVLNGFEGYRAGRYLVAILVKASQHQLVFFFYVTLCYDLLTFDRALSMLTCS